MFFLLTAKLLKNLNLLFFIFHFQTSRDFILPLLMTKLTSQFGEVKVSFLISVPGFYPKPRLPG